MTDAFGDAQQSLQRRSRARISCSVSDIPVLHPAVPKLFERTDFDNRIALLRHGLSASIAFRRGTKVEAYVLKRIGETHGRVLMNVDLALNPYWIHSLVQAVSDVDPRYTRGLGHLGRSRAQRACDCHRWPPIAFGRFN